MKAKLPEMQDSYTGFLIVDGEVQDLETDYQPAVETLWRGLGRHLDSPFDKERE